MNHKIHFIEQLIIRSLFLLFFLQISLSAQNNAYTIDEAINLALKNNRDINISVMNVKKAAAAVNQAYGYAMPSLDFSANFSHFLRKPLMSFPDFGALLQNATYSILFDEMLSQEMRISLNLFKTLFNPFHRRIIIQHS